MVKSFLPFKKGIPSHGCIRYVLIRLPPEQLQSAFTAWVKALKKKFRGRCSGWENLKGSQKRELGGLHMVSAWGASNKLVLG